MRPLTLQSVFLAAGVLMIPAAGQASNDADCLAPEAWFPHSQTPMADYDADFMSNCAFHRWSWQAFLALTKEAGDGRLVFETFVPSADVIAGERSGAARPLSPRLGKSDSLQGLDEVMQAGSLGLLVDQNGRAVYYSQYVDESFFDFAITQNGFHDPAKLRAAPDDLNLPIGALTLKAAWRIVPEGARADDHYTTRGTIQLLTENAAGHVIIDETRSEEATLALVGLHVVGVVKGHPEAIWATFEHRSNAPDFPSGIGRDDPVSDKDFTFYAAGASAGDCNQNNAGDLRLTDAAAQTLAPVTQACRQFAFGGGDAENIGNIASLNASVHAQLEEGSVWRNYFETGAIWFGEEDALAPNMRIPADLLDGSVQLSSTVIETFTQKTINENQCFACHNAQAQVPEGAPEAFLPGKNLNISHVLVNTYMSNLPETD